MLSRFLSECKVINENQNNDYINMYNKLTNKKIFTSFIPLRAIDVFPYYALTNKADFINPDNLTNVFFVSLSENNYMGVTHLEDILLDLYKNSKVSDDLLKNNTKLNNTILLKHPLFDKSFDLLEYGNPNVIYQSYVLDNNINAHVFYIPSTPLFLYKNILEENHIKVDLLADYKLGLGKWNEKNPLFNYLINPKYDYLAPKYYLKEYEEYSDNYGELIYRKYINDFICEIYKL